MKPMVKIYARPALRMMRTQRLLPMEEVAAAVGCSLDWYGMVERGDRSASIGLARKIVNYFRLPESAFMDVFKYIDEAKYEDTSAAS